MKKAAAFQLKAGSLSAPTTKMNQKRKNQGDEERPLKKIVSQPIALDSAGSQGTPNLPCHGVGKGLMMARGLILNEPVPP